MKCALITGATSGIGYELAHIAAQKRIDLILVGRNEEKLTQTKIAWEKEYAIRVNIIRCDLSEPDAIEQMIESLQSLAVQVDVLINNAGFGLFGEFDETDMQKENNMLQVNVVFLTQLTKYLYRQMKEQKHGYILNVASVAGFMPGPLMAVYYATKAYVLSFSQALSNEAKGTGVSVTALCPGPTETNFAGNAALESSMLFKSFGKLPGAKEVAAYGFRCMEKKKAITIYGTMNRAMVFLTRFLPKKMVCNMVRYVQRKI